MAGKNGSAKNGHSRLDEAMALLIGNQASFVASMADINSRHAELEREANERVDRLEAQMREVVRILTDHTRQLEKLTEAVRDRIGFKVGP